MILVEDLSGAACEVGTVHLKEDRPLTLGVCVQTTAFANLRKEDQGVLMHLDKVQST